ncbi:MAG: glycosyltransferase family 2 protein [Bacteroidales bacterium]|nr:glycosyltransferase family 2 protein [Bacteroidales bacterium]
MDISIIVPVYNEEESLRELSAWIARVMKKNNYSYEIVMVDDGSSDSSWNEILKCGQRNSNIKGIRFRRNYGKSAALQTGFEAAQGNVVITMDADLQDSPDEIPELYKMIRNDGYDMVSGWKKVRHDPLHKRIPSKFYNATVRKMSGIKLHDMNCGLKAYKLDVVKNIEIYGEMHRYIPIIAKWAGFKKIGEKIVQHYARKFGKSKFGMERYMKGYLDLMTVLFVSRYGKRPMHFFGLIGTLVFFIGFIITIFLICTKYFGEIYISMTSRPLFYFALLAMVLGTILFVGGFLAELVCRNSTERNKYLIWSTYDPNAQKKIQRERHKMKAKKTDEKAQPAEVISNKATKE